MATKIHSSAVIASGARLGHDVTVGAFVVVGDDVTVGDGSELEAHVVVYGPTVLGRENRVSSFAVVGGEPQAKKQDGDRRATLSIGERNVVREHVTIHRGSTGAGTGIGDDNLFMAGCHVAHDVDIGSHVTIANGTQLAGHVVVESHVTFGGLAGVAQFVRVGESAFVAGGAMCERNVPPFVIVQGDRARVRALNVVGLRRRGVPEASIASLLGAYMDLFGGKGTRADALAKVSRVDPYVRRLAEALERG